MRKLLFLGCTLVLPFQLRAAEAPPAPVKVTISPGKTWGTWEGWGTSLAWWAKVFGDRDDLADVVFTTKTVSISGESLPGLGLNIARYNAGACTWNQVNGRKMEVSKIIAPFRQIEGYWLDGESTDPGSKSWDWSKDANQRAMLLKAKDRGADRFELFSNSPLWWMCANGNPSGAKNGREDNLPARNYQAFATYLATIAKHAKESWGISFSTVEPFNEPTSGYWFADCKQEGCQFNPPAQAAWLPILRAELDRQGLRDVAIAASDESFYDQALKTWNSFGEDTRRLVDRVNVHGYQLAKGNRAELYHQVTEQGGKLIWNSEHGEKIASGCELARNINRDLHALHPVAWCYWQPLDAGGWGLLQADLKRSWIGKANPKYFVLAQYSRHIRPGMIILDCSDPNTVAAYDPRAHKLVLVSLNEGPNRAFCYELSPFQRANSVITRVQTSLKGNARYQRLPDVPLARTHSISMELLADSVMTLEVSNVVAP